MGLLRFIRIRKQLCGFAQIYQDQDQDQETIRGFAQIYQDQETIRWVCSDSSGSGSGNNEGGLLSVIRIRKQLGGFAQIYQDQETIRWVCSDFSGSRSGSGSGSGNN